MMRVTLVRLRVPMVSEDGPTAIKAYPSGTEFVISILEAFTVELSRVMPTGDEMLVRDTVPKEVTVRLLKKTLSAVVVELRKRNLPWISKRPPTIAGG